MNDLSIDKLKSQFKFGVMDKGSSMRVNECITL